MSTLQRELRLLRAAVMFLTRLPVTVGTAPPTDQLARAAKHFPLVGVIVGGLAGAVWLSAASVLPAAAAAGLAVAAGILLTGALHEDGWSDCCDGLGGGATREKALEIMRDSRVGAYGALGLVFSVGLRWAGLMAFDPWTGFAALVVSHTIGRGMIVLTLGIAHYARPDGAGRGVAGGVHPGELGIACFAVALIACIAAGWAGVIALMAAAAAGATMIALLIRKLGGYTGDGLGAIEQVAEVAALLTLAATMT